MSRVRFSTLLTGVCAIASPLAALIVIDSPLTHALRDRKARPRPLPPTMAQLSSLAMALASATDRIDIPKPRDVSPGTNFVGTTKAAADLPTPPNSVSPDLRGHGIYAGVQSPPAINIEQDAAQDNTAYMEMDEAGDSVEPAGQPLSRGALSGLDASNTITPAMLAKHHLPGIMLGNGPRPIRYVMGELTQQVPGFSRIPPAKARRLVVAALENRAGGGLDGNVAFCKTGWGRWDAHIKGSSKDSGVGSFNEGHMSPPRSERSFAVSNGDSGVHMPGPKLPAGYRDQRSGGSWTASSIREEDELELDMDMDVPENEADKMSLDGQSMDDSSSTSNDDTDDDDWAAVGAAALRKASLPTPGAPRTNYHALDIRSRRPSRGVSRTPSAFSYRIPLHSASLPQHSGFGGWNGSTLDPAMATPEERDAAAALMSMGSM